MLTRVYILISKISMYQWKRHILLLPSDQTSCGGYEIRWIFSINSYSAGSQQAWQRGDTGNVNPLSRLERQARMRPAASRQIFIAQNFACTSLTCQCVYVKIFRLENPKRKARSWRIKTGTSFPSLALIPFAWAPRSVSVLCFQLGFSFGFYLCLIYNGFLTYYVRVSCSLWSFWWPSSWRFTLKNHGEKIMFDCFCRVGCLKFGEGKLEQCIDR